MTIPRNLSNLAPGASTSGVLDTAHGGTGTSTTFTAGSVVFAGGSGVYSQDNAQFFWDDTNNRLGVGTATPTEQISIANATPTFSMSTPVDGNRVEQRFYNDGTQIWTVGLNYSGSDGHYFMQRDFGGGNVLMAPDGNGNVGIGTSFATFPLTVSFNAPATWGNAAGNFAQMWQNSGTNAIGIAIGDDGNASISTNNGYNLLFATQGSERMRITSSGNVGIGTNNPLLALDVVGDAAFTGTVQAPTVPGQNFAIRARASTGDSTAGIFQLTNNSGSAQWASVASPAINQLTFNNGGSLERGRFNDYWFLLNTTTNFDFVSDAILQVYSTANAGLAIKINGAGPGSFQSFFDNSGGRIGYIGFGGNTTSYNTTSDYRLKENVAPLTGGLDTVLSLNPVSYSWKASQQYGEGFIAHELAEAVPLAVSGEKDAVNKDGSINPQGVDYSKIVVHLVSAVQELKAELDAVKAELAALKGA